MLDDFWVWDSWYAEQAGLHHAFYLMAPRPLGDPELRHSNARIGHSVSADLTSWRALPDVLTAGVEGDFDDLALWTGSVVRHGDTWHMFYTGVATATTTSVQRIGHAVSSDLMTWTRVSPSPVATADGRWYTTTADPRATDEPWRDPWVFRSADDGLWHMLVTARESGDAEFAHGTIGHCVSDDLETWRVTEPLTTNSGFRQLEVVQVAEVDGHHVLVFCAAASDVLDPRVKAVTGTYSAPADSELGPFHLELAEPIAAPGIYAGRVVANPHGDPVLLGFVDSGLAGGFAGVICDPVPLVLTERGTLQPSRAADETVGALEAPEALSP